MSLQPRNREKKLANFNKSTKEYSKTFTKHRIKYL